MKVLILLFSTLINTYASILVLEFKDKEQSTWHGIEVSAVACNVPEAECLTKYTDSFAYQNLSYDIIAAIEKSDIINMSFSVFKPAYPDYNPMREDNSFETDLVKYHDALDSFEQDKKSLESIIKNNQEKLFSIASGNGVFVRFMSTPGVAMIEKYAIFPSFFNFPNTIKVSALDQEKIDILNLKNHSIAFYSNYGLERVDIAAPVPRDTNGKIQKGTSFAAPFISKMAQIIKASLPNLNAIQIKEIIMKSVHVPNIKMAIWATQDLKNNGITSIVHLAQYHPQRVKRLELQKKLKGMMLVKSGGFIVPEVLSKCTEILKLTSQTIEKSCLIAHQKVLSKSSEELNMLQSLWRLRNI